MLRFLVNLGGGGGEEDVGLPLSQCYMVVGQISGHSLSLLGP